MPSLYSGEASNSTKKEIVRQEKDEIGAIQNVADRTFRTAYPYSRFIHGRFIFGKDILSGNMAISMAVGQ